MDHVFQFHPTFYREDAVSKFLRMLGDFLPEHEISNINSGSSSNVASVLSDSDLQPMWPSWMYGLCAFGPLRTCVQLTFDLCVTVESGTSYWPVGKCWSGFEFGFMRMLVLFCEVTTVR